MNELQIFNYQDNEVRTIRKDGEPWFVLRDVCKVLDLSTPSRVAERLDQDEVSQTHITDSLGRQQETTIINESGLYNVILRSDKPEAKPFRKWVTGTVLPSLRRNGTYSLPGAATVYPPKATSVGEVAQLLKVIRATMKDNDQPPEIIAQAVKGICDQFGITLPSTFVRVNPFQQSIPWPGMGQLSN